jgi:gliding motility-associated-like protein
MRKFTLVAALFFVFTNSFGQDFSNKGKEFWLAYCYHVGMVNAGGAPAMTLYLTSDVTTTYTVEIYGGATISTGTINANQVVSVTIPNTYFISAYGLTTGRTVHVTAVKPIVVYSFITRSAASAATLALPVNVLGREYYASSYTQISNENNASSYITIIGVENNTTVEITPTATANGNTWTAGTTYTININKGEIYQVLGQTTGNNGVDLSGTKIKSVAGAGGGCKRIAVFSGSGKLSISTTGCTQSSADNLYQQLYPSTTWGKRYLMVPSSARPYNYYRIYRPDATTNVYVNGTLVPPASFSNNYYQFYNNTANLVDADKPVSVAQYFTTQGCPAGAGGNPSPYDPDMIMLNPVEQNINKVTLVNSPLTATGTHLHNIHVIMKNSGAAISSFRFDGAVPAAAWTVHPQDANYSYLYLANVAAGNHTLYSDSGFNALAYGYANAETYGYSAGANVKDLYQQIGVSTEYGIEQTPSVCTNSPFRFKVSLPYCADSIKWNLGNLPGPPATPPTSIYSTCTPGAGGPDSTSIINGKTIYWYSLPNLYNFSTTGTYPVTITTFFPSSECGGTQDIDFDLQISNPPVPGFTEVLPGCYTEPVQFIETTPQSPKATYKWYWDFGDGNTSAAKDPAHTYTAAGTYTVRYASITTPGCLSDTIQHSVIIPKLPEATISGTTAVCAGATQPFITFTGAEGKAPYEFTYSINGGAPLTVISVTNTATVAASTATAGTFVYNLISVRNVGSALCVQPQAGSATVTVNPLPTASVSGNTTVCLNATPPNITFTGATGTAPYTFTYNINGGASQTITTTSGNSVTIAVPTTAAGTFAYNLLSVQDGTSTACSQTQTSTATVVVNPLPTASVSGNTTVCLNATPPNITFTGTTGTAPYTFTYNINGGASQTITTIAGNSVTVSVPTNVAGTFTYNLISVKEGSSNACVQLQSGSATVIVNPLPTAAIAGNITVCLNATQPLITFSGGNATAPYTFTYNINGGAAQTITTLTGNSITLAAPTNVAGTFVYTLMSVQDGTTTACTQVQTGSATVVVKALPTATIAGTTNVCLNATSPNITFTGATGTAPYTFTYNINGGASQTISTITGNTVTISAPTNVTGTFTYNLINVTESSTNTCTQVQSGSATVVVNPLPTAGISGTAAVCLNAPQPLITFTGGGATSPYTFTYNINGGASQTITTTTGNSITLAAPTNVAGTFVYNLVSVRDGSSTLCSQNQTGAATITVYPLPVLNFTTNTPLCETRDISFTDNSNPLIGTLTNWSWSFGDPASGVLNASANQNPKHIYNIAGTYTVSLIVTTSNGCANAVPFTKTVVINDRPKAGFIVPEVCINDVAAVFTDTSKIANGTISPAGYEWNYGDPPSGGLNSSTAMNGSHLYTLVGPYNVRHIVTSTLGCKDTVTNIIFINGADPVANFSVTNAAALCANDSIAIVNLSTITQGSVTKLEIYWDVAGAPTVFQLDDFPAFNKVYRHLYPNFQTPATRTYNIRVVAYSGTLCLNTKTIPVTINAAPKVQFNNMAAVCYTAAPFVITQASEIGGVPGTFKYSGPGIVNTNGLFNPAAAGIGTHRILYTFTSTAAGCADTASKLITVIDTSSAKFSFISPTCQGNSTTFKEESTAPSGVTLVNTVWDFGDGSPLENHAPGTTFTHIYANWGNYTVTMYNTSAYGCRSSNKQQQVYVSPIPNTVFAFGQTTVCIPNANVSFINNSTIADGTENAFTYLWNFGDVASGGLNTSLAKTPPPHHYSGTGPYIVTLTVTSGNGCSKTTTLPVNFIHPQPKTVFNFNKTSVCIGDNVLMTDITDGLDGTISQWFWKFSDGGSGSTKQVSYLFGSAKIFDVSLYTINSNGCNSDTLTKQFTVYPYPAVDAGADRVVLEGGSIKLQPVVTGNLLQYLWTPNTYLDNDRIEQPTASNMLDDITYTLTVTGEGGCTAPPDKMFVKVLKAPKVPNTFTPNGDGINDTWKIEYLDTYPNNKVQVFTRTGQLVFESRGYKTPWDGRMNGKPLPFDTYYYIIEPENGRKPVTGYVTIVK